MLLLHLYPPPPFLLNFFPFLEGIPLPNFLPLFKGEEYKEGVTLRKKIPIPHLSPPPSQREGGGLREDPPPTGRGRKKVGEEVPPLSSSSDTDEIGKVIYFFEGPPTFILPSHREREDWRRIPSVSFPLERRILSVAP